MSRSPMLRGSAFVIALMTLPAGAAAQNASTALLRWCERIASSVDLNAVNPTKTVVDDHFGPIPYSAGGRRRFALAAGGAKVDTAGSGSYWVYDAVHHIAAVSEFGDVNGDTVEFVDSPPPAPLPARNLSRVTSARGLRLGMTVEEVAARIGIAASTAVRTSSNATVLYARKDRKCGTYDCAYDASIIFRNGHAVSISLDDIGP